MGDVRPRRDAVAVRIPAGKLEWRSLEICDLVATGVPGDRSGAV